MARIWCRKIRQSSFSFPSPRLPFMGSSKAKSAQKYAKSAQKYAKSIKERIYAAKFQFHIPTPYRSRRSRAACFRRRPKRNRQHRPRPRQRLRTPRRRHPKQLPRRSMHRLRTIFLPRRKSANKIHNISSFPNPIPIYRRPIGSFWHKTPTIHNAMAMRFRRRFKRTISLAPRAIPTSSTKRRQPPSSPPRNSMFAN